MWYFRSPQIVFGEEALSHLEEIKGKRAIIVTDATIRSLGFVDRVQQRLAVAGVESACFSEIEPEPTLNSVQRCAQAMLTYDPDWIIGLGGGSCLDAAKSAWFLYERPDVELEAINPLEKFGMRTRARLLTIPTTAGSGSEVSQAAVIRDEAGRRKLELASYELVPDITIVDPALSAQMPNQLTIDTGIDVLAHTIDAYNNQWSNDFTDGLCLQAISLVFEYLPRAASNGATDPLAREKMANAATIAGLGICNANISLAHALGHAAGAIFNLPHGRVTAIFTPGSIEFIANGGFGRYLKMARLLGLPAENETQAAFRLSSAIRALMRSVGLPLDLESAGIERARFDLEVEALCDRAEMDLGIVMAPRFPDRQELQRLFEYAYAGRTIDF